MKDNMPVAVIIGMIVGISIALGGAILKIPKVKGMIGEHTVRRKISKIEDGVQYVINDALLTLKPNPAK